MLVILVYWLKLRFLIDIIEANLLDLRNYNKEKQE